jgi:hypothetical protein
MLRDGRCAKGLSGSAGLQYSYNVARAAPEYGTIWSKRSRRRPERASSHTADYLRSACRWLSSPWPSDQTDGVYSTLTPRSCMQESIASPCLAHHDQARRRTGTALFVLQKQKSCGRTFPTCNPSTDRDIGPCLLQLPSMPVQGHLSQEIVIGDAFRVS